MSNYSQLILAGLLLMGFKPRSSVKNYFHIRPAQFLYPSEKVIYRILNETANTPKPIADFTKLNGCMLRNTKELNSRSDE